MGFAVLIVTPTGQQSSVACSDLDECLDVVTSEGRTAPRYTFFRLYEGVRAIGLWAVGSRGLRRLRRYQRNGGDYTVTTGGEQVRGLDAAGVIRYARALESELEIRAIDRATLDGAVVHDLWSNRTIGLWTWMAEAERLGWTTPGGHTR